MDKNRGKIGLFLFFFFLFSGCATPGSKYRDMEIQKLRTQITTLEQQIKDADREIEDLERQLERERQLRRGLEKRLVMKKSQPSQKENITSRPTNRDIQIALKNAGFYKGPIDGKLGPQTKKAIENFQRAKGLKVDGVVGRKTWKELRKYLP